MKVHVYQSEYVLSREERGGLISGETNWDTVEPLPNMKADRLSSKVYKANLPACVIEEVM